MTPSPEPMACHPVPVDRGLFNPEVSLPYGLTADHVASALDDLVNFLGLVNPQLNSRGLPRLESIMMPAGFSSLVSEFVLSAIPKHCTTLARNTYHNGHPDLLPTDKFPNNARQHATEGIEVKASRYTEGWQGHNPEDCWLMVVVFESNRPRDEATGVAPFAFRFRLVAIARLKKDDWAYSGRGETSRRTITASVKASGRKKLMRNWVYRDER